MDKLVIYENCNVIHNDLYRLDNIACIDDAITLLHSSYAGSFTYDNGAKICYFKTDIQRCMNSHIKRDSSSFITVAKIIEDYVAYDFIKDDNYNYNYKSQIWHNLDIMCNDLYKITNISAEDAINNLYNKYAGCMSYDLHEKVAYYKINHNFINYGSSENADISIFSKIENSIRTNFISVACNYNSISKAQLCYITEFKFSELVQYITNNANALNANIYFIFSNINVARTISKYIWPLFPKSSKMGIMLDPISEGEENVYKWALNVLETYKINADIIEI